jgi:hypothetical protein
VNVQTDSDAPKQRSNFVRDHRRALQAGISEAAALSTPNPARPKYSRRRLASANKPRMPAQEYALELSHYRSTLIILQSRIGQAGIMQGEELNDLSKFVARCEYALHRTAYIVARSRGESGPALAQFMKPGSLTLCQAASLDF